MIFTKGNILYNYNLAKQTARHDGYIYVVEGFMDVFAFDTIGITSCVALMSTKLTKQHIELLRKLGVEIRICLDGDKPGQSAMMQLMAQLDEARLPYRLVSVPGEIRDPDEILKQDGEEKLKVFVNSLVDPFNFALNYYQNISPLCSIEDKKKVIHHFMTMISSLKDKLVQEDYIYKLAEATGFTASAIRNSLADFRKAKAPVVATLTNVNAEVDTSLNLKALSRDVRRLTLAERTVLDMMFISDEAVKFYEQDIKYFYNEVFRSIANFILEQYKTSGVVDPSALLDEINVSDIKNKNDIISEISAISFRKDKAKFSKRALHDCQVVINEERTKIYEKNKLKQDCLGKSPEEQARILTEYLSKKNKN